MKKRKEHSKKGKDVVKKSKKKKVSKLEKSFKENIKMIVRSQYPSDEGRSMADKKFTNKIVEELSFQNGKIFTYSNKNYLGAVVPLPNSNSYWTDLVFQLYRLLESKYKNTFIDWKETNNLDLEKFTGCENNLLIIVTKKGNE